MDTGLRVKGMGAEDVRVRSWVRFAFPPSSGYLVVFLGKNLGKSELTEG